MFQLSGQRRRYESLVKRGLASRAEVTDAAMSGRAECVMLNKGPRILVASRFSTRRAGAHGGYQTKKSALMRKLSVAESAWKSARSLLALTKR